MRKSLAIAVCLLPVLPLLAADGAIPIWEPITITEPGKYVVTRNIAGAAGSPVVEIAASNVEIDLNAFTLTASQAPAVRATGYSDITVRNGSIEGGSAGIVVVGGPRGQVVIEGVRIRDVEGKGIHLDQVYQYALRRNLIQATGEEAILVDRTAGDGSLPGTIEDNQIGYPNGYGIAIRYGRELSILDNVIDDTGTTAIYLLNSWVSLIQGNRIKSPGIEGVTTGEGIHLDNSHAFEIRDNTIVHGQGHGILVSGDDNLVVRNVVKDVDSSGCYVEGDRNYLISNIFNNNKTRGLHFTAAATDNLFRGNMARQNITGDFADNGTGNTSHGDNYMPNQM